MSDDQYPKTPEQKLDRMIDLLERIEQHLAPPPLWQRSLKFAFDHFAIILSLIGLLYVTWKIWGTISNVSENVDSIKSLMLNVSGSVGESIRGLRFWDDSPAP